MRSGPSWRRCCRRSAPGWAGRPRTTRLIVEAIVWLDRTGVPWRDLPGEFGPGRRWPAGSTAGAARACGTGCFRRCRPMRTRGASWTGCCSSSTGRWCEPTSTLPGPGGGLRPTWRSQGAGGLPPILTSRVIGSGSGRRWAAAARLLHQAAPSGRRRWQADGDPGHRRAAQRGADAACAHAGRRGQAAAGSAPDPPGRGRGRLRATAAPACGATCAAAASRR